MRSYPLSFFSAHIFEQSRLLLLYWQLFHTFVVSTAFLGTVILHCWIICINFRKFNSLMSNVETLLSLLLQFPLIVVLFLLLFFFSIISWSPIKFSFSILRSMIEMNQFLQMHLNLNLKFPWFILNLKHLKILPNTRFLLVPFVLLPFCKPCLPYKLPKAGFCGGPTPSFGRRVSTEFCEQSVLSPRLVLPTTRYQCYVSVATIYICIYILPQTSISRSPIYQPDHLFLVSFSNGENKCIHTYLRYTWHNFLFRSVSRKMESAEKIQKACIRLIRALQSANFMMSCLK